MIYLYSHSSTLCNLHKYPTAHFKEGSNKNTSGTDSGTTSVENIWTAKDDDIVAWATSDSLSDEEKEYYQVKFKDFYPEYSFTIANYGLDETNSAYASYAQAYRKNIIDMLTNEKLILRKAKELGLDQLTEE